MNSSVPDGKCPAVGQFLAGLSDKWRVMILIQLSRRVQRFGELRRAIDGISQRMLSLTLKNLERDGLIKRTATPSIPPRVDYELTALGRDMLPYVQNLGGWVATNLESIDAARSDYDRNQATGLD